MSDVPTLNESDVHGYELVSWGGALAPKGTPELVIERLNAAMLKTAKDPGFQQRLIGMGVEPDVMSRQDFKVLITEELPKWARIAEVSGAEQK